MVLIEVVSALTTGWRAIDPLVALAIGLWLVPRALRLLRTAHAVTTRRDGRHVRFRIADGGRPYLARGRQG